jgi:hypothetical protein
MISVHAPHTSLPLPNGVEAVFARLEMYWVFSLIKPKVSNKEFF